MPRRGTPVKPGEQARHLSVVVDAEMIKAIDEEAERLGKQMRVKLTRTDIVRRWLDHAAKCPKARD